METSSGGEPRAFQQASGAFQEVLNTGPEIHPQNQGRRHAEALQRRSISRALREMPAGAREAHSRLKPARATPGEGGENTAWVVSTLITNS